MSFDPNGVGVANGNIFGFPCTEEDADLIIIPIPWDATASYGKGTSNGPQAILDASTQLDFFHPKVRDAYETKVCLTPISDEWKAINDSLNERASQYFSDLELLGEDSAREKHKEIIAEINEAHAALTKNLKSRVGTLIQSGKICAVLGGEHSTPLGLIQALNAHYSSFSILQIDAHADLRKAYEGFEQSHASIMYNVVESCSNLNQLVQVGIRDLSADEHELSLTHPKITTFFDWNLKEEGFIGKTWNTQCEEIIESLSNDVYISFDIDGLIPNLCPNTGTPVAGGFTLEQLSFLMFKVVDSGRRIVGFDLNEVSPGSTGDWDANVGARALWQLVCATELSRRKTC
jgi:agmatinase